MEQRYNFTSYQTYFEVRNTFRTEKKNPESSISSHSIKSLTKALQYECRTKGLQKVKHNPLFFIPFTVL